jgi:hypothetical protein
MMKADPSSEMDHFECNEVTEQFSTQQFHYYKQATVKNLQTILWVSCTVRDDWSLFQNIDKWESTCFIQFLSSSGVHFAYTDEVLKAQPLQQNCPLTPLGAIKYQNVNLFPTSHEKTCSSGLFRTLVGNLLTSSTQKLWSLMNTNGSGCSIIKSHLC